MAHARRRLEARQRVGLIKAFPGATNIAKPVIHSPRRSRSACAAKYSLCGTLPPPTLNSIRSIGYSGSRVSSARRFASVDFPICCSAGAGSESKQRHNREEMRRTATRRSFFLPIGDDGEVQDTVGSKPANSSPTSSCLDALFASFRYDRLSADHLAFVQLALMTL
jgi:hypothetical protein